jgi:predicted DCC family thiol-disulfide oxidoreductase YuxK
MAIEAAHRHPLGGVAVDPEAGGQAPKVTPAKGALGAMAPIRPGVGQVSESPERTAGGSPIEDGPIVLFDGVCNLCNATVQWLLDRDEDERLRFASLQSEAAAGVLRDAGIDDPSSLPDSIVLVDQVGVHIRSAAALRIGGTLGFPFSLGRLGLLVPRPIRDGVYALIARNRYRWFGRRDVCMRPIPELAARFLDAGEPVVPVFSVDEPVATGEDARSPRAGP